MIGFVSERSLGEVWTVDWRSGGAGARLEAGSLLRSQLQVTQAGNNGGLCQEWSRCWIPSVQ